MSTVSAIGGMSAAGLASEAGRVSSDDFLRLLVTQLQNQDPLEPMSNEDFLAQLAQFQALEEMMATSRNTASMLLGARLGLAGGLIGRTVTALTPSGLYITGVVERVSVADGVPLLVIGGARVDVEAVTEVF